MIDESSTNQEVVNAFKNALKENNPEAIARILTLTSANKLTLEQLETEIKTKLEAGSWPCLHSVLNILNKESTEYTLSSGTINLIFKNSFSLGQWNIVSEILSGKQASDLNPRILERSCFAATMSHRPEIISSIAKLANEKGLTLGLSRENTQLDRLIGHRLGLLGEPFVGLKGKACDYYNTKRFSDLTRRLMPELSISFDTLNISKMPATQKLSDFLASDETISNIACGWEEHVFGITLLKENDELHVVYTNRGDKPHERGELPTPVVVYTLKTDTEKKDFLDNMEKALRTENREVICNFFAKSEVKSTSNPELSAVFAKSHQKTGNCSFANTNIFWHFALAQEYRRAHPSVSLSDAYMAVKEDYKKMRQQDRIDAFQDLLSFPDSEVRDNGIRQYTDKIIKQKIDNLYFIEGFLDSLTKDQIAVLDSVKMSDGTSAWANLTLALINKYCDNPDFLKKLIDKAKDDPSEKKYIDLLLVYAAQTGKIDLIKHIIDNKIDNKPCPEAIKTAMVYAWNTGRMDICLDLFKIKGENRPSNLDFLPLISKAVDEAKWDFIQEIINIDDENALPNETITLLITGANASLGADLKYPLRMLHEVTMEMKETLSRIRADGEVTATTTFNP